MMPVAQERLITLAGNRSLSADHGLQADQVHRQTRSTGRPRSSAHLNDPQTLVPLVSAVKANSQNFEFQKAPEAINYLKFDEPTNQRAKRYLGEVNLF